ncbi:MAG TPA: LysR family transcriptional regulator [Blastocatellia bacterium]|nr:LysR family transcriptional regulator [Blastocatellia bacterium]
MEIRQLRTFLAIAETRSFTRAAQRVHLTQAAVSAQIKALESEIGTPLFARVNKKVYLTEAGGILLGRAQKIVRGHDEALFALAEITQAEGGRLRLGTASTMASIHPLPKILADLKIRHPQAQITVFRGTSAEIVARILGNDLDFGLASLPVEAPDIRAERLRQDLLVAIVPPGHRLAKQRSVTARQLADESLILGEEGGNTRRMIDLFFDKAGCKAEVTMELGSMTAIKRMVEHGLGVSIVPRSSVRDEVTAGRLHALAVRELKAYWELGLVSLKTDHLSPVQQTFRQLCKKYFEHP